MTQEIAEQQTPDNGTNAGGDATTAAPGAGDATTAAPDAGDATTAAPDTTNAPTAAPTPAASNIMDLIKRAVDKITAKLLETLSTQQADLNAANVALRKCGTIYNESTQDDTDKEPRSVSGWHSAHDRCRRAESDLEVDLRKKNKTLHAHADTMGWPPSNAQLHSSATIVEHWRHHFKVVAPIFEENYHTFVRLDEEFLAAEALHSQKRTACNQKQAAYESSVCSYVEDGGSQDSFGTCVSDKAQKYNETIQRVRGEDRKRAAQYTIMKRIFCYINAQQQDENFAHATHHCHSLTVDTTPAKATYPGWPPMPKDASKATMYPCGKVWLSYAYGALPKNAPANDCAKCPNLPDLDAMGGVFVRWGSLSCPDQSQFVYKGIAAGSGHAQSGNGANLVCLVEDPSDAPATNDGNNNHAIFYGVQYYDLYAGSYTQHSKAGCSTCAFSGATYTMWGSVNCAAGHVTLYTGNVMSSHHSHQRSEWACVDTARETHFKSENGNHESIRWYLAEYDCGSLPCGPFSDTMEVACAQCGIPDEAVSVYTRWGHDECGGDSELIYTGAAGSAAHNQAGGGYNSMCLTMDPSEAPDKADGAQNHARVYGTEYEAHYAGQSRNNHDAACAVCAYKGSATYTAWGTTECGAEHSVLYNGNILGDHHGHYKAEWVCVDPELKSHASDDAGNQDGTLWYQAEYECGSIPCTPYTQNKEGACAVCGIPKDAGSVFTRWGHRSCPASSRLVYEGLVAGGHHGHRGGGANPLCLSRNPTDAPATEAGNQDHALLYGVEYNDQYGGAPTHQDWDAACAVCSYGGSAAYDMWGKVSCPQDHEVLYVGNVMAGHHGHKKFNYVCVDEERQEHFQSNNGNNDHGLWYSAEYECGSLPCGPYNTNKEAACAKCGIPGMSVRQQTCSSSGSRSSCPPSRCAWVDSACRTACMTFSTNVTCSDGCLWDNQISLCQEQCEDFTSVDECPVGRCMWTQDACSPFGTGPGPVDANQ